MLKNYRRWFTWIGLGAVLVLLCLRAGSLMNISALGLGDYIAYWSAGRLNAWGQNPYSPEDLLPVQQAEGWPEEWPNIMYYPPWALPLVMPLGLLPFSISRLLWLLVEVVVVIYCADRTWRYYNGPISRRWLAWLLALIFVPTLIALRMGQMSPFLLLGIVGFLEAERRGLDWLAGAFLLLAAVKPQLLYLFGIGVLVWSADRRRWRVVAGGLVAGAVALLIALLCNPHVLEQYRFALSHPPSGNITPTAGALLRLAFGHDLVWLQFVPTAIGLGWFPAYYARYRNNWRWDRQAPLLLLVSFLTSSYGSWVFDLPVLLIPVLAVSLQVWQSGRRDVATFAVTGFLLCDAVALALNLTGATYLSFIWMTPALLIAYLMLRARAHVPRLRQPCFSIPVPATADKAVASEPAAVLQEAVN
jgi:hypothetical protein